MKINKAYIFRRFFMTTNIISNNSFANTIISFKTKKMVCKSYFDGPLTFQYSGLFQYVFQVRKIENYAYFDNIKLDDPESRGKYKSFGKMSY